MPLIIKLCLVAIIWAIGICFGLTSSSDPAGQGYAIAIPIISALIVSIPFAFSISRTPVSENVRQRKALRILLHAPLVLAVSPVVLIVVGYLIFFAIHFIKFVVVLGVAGLAVWSFVVYRKRKRARCAAATQNPPAEVVVPELPVPHPIPVAPVAKPPKPPRVRKPVCGIWAWVLPLLAVPIGILLGYLAGRGNYEGFQAWAILGWLFFPLILAVPTSFILAIVSLCRRERYPSLAITMLVLYVIAFALSFPYGGLTPLLALAVGGLMLARWLFKRRRRKRVASGRSQQEGI